jgi:hypothetical protein
MKKFLLTSVAALFLATGTALQPAQAYCEYKGNRWEADFRKCQIEKCGDDQQPIIVMEDFHDIMRGFKFLKKCMAFWKCVEDREVGKVKHCYENDKRWR